MKKLVHQLEAYYETRGSKADEEAPNLSPDIQTFLHDIDKRFGRN